MTLTEQILSDNEAKIRAVELTDQEKEEAQFEGQKKKYFKEKHKPYWDEQEKTQCIIRCKNIFKSHTA